MTAVTQIAGVGGPLRAVDPPRPRSLADFVDATGFRSLVLGSSKDPNAKVTILLVSPKSGAPVFAAKVPTSDIAARAVEAEASVLTSLQEAELGQVAETIPRVVEVVEHHGRTVLVATALPGTPLTKLYAGRRHTASSTRVSADFAAVATWLRDFQSETATGPAHLESDAGFADRIRARFADLPLAEDDAARMRELEARLRADEHTGTAVHGDLWFGNVLVADGRVSGIVDWEAAGTSGDPTRDVVRFALGYALYLDRRTRQGREVRGHPTLVAGRWGAAVEFALDGAGWFPELFRQFVREGLAHVGASPAAWRDYVLAGIAEVAATADDREFAGRHLDLFRRVAGRQSWRAAE